jgi:hypothetical protein
MMVVVVTALVAGSLDLGAALLFFVIRSKQNHAMLLRYIASAVFGPRAFSDGSRMVVAGICFHYVIALCWVGFYLAVYPWVRSWRTGLLLDAAVYGLFVWVIMNRVVLPLSRAVPRPFSLSFLLINMLILVIAIGLPCTYAARHFAGGWFCH